MYVKLKVMGIYQYMCYTFSQVNNIQAYTYLYIFKDFRFLVFLFYNENVTILEFQVFFYK